MMSSTESQNQLQQCLDRLSEVAKTPDERRTTISMAWNGYISDIVEKESEAIIPNWLLELAVGEQLAGEGKCPTPIDYKGLQHLGNEVLEAGYAIWRDKGIKLFESAMVEAAGAVQIAWKQIVCRPEPNPFIPGPGLIAATFSGAQQIFMMGYIATANSLMVFPSANASIKNNSFWQSLTESFTNSESIVLQMFQTSTRFSSKGNCDEEVIISGLGNLSFLELYFSDMITAEYSASKKEIGQLKLTTRDGRNFALCANQEVSKLVREAIRASKGIAQGSSPASSITPA